MLGKRAPTTYDPALSMREARRRYFEANGFGDDGGYSAKWVHVALGPVPLAFPNTKARVAAVRYHDLHHVLTGYQTDIIGEFEISAWEIGAGCKSFVAAWQLNLGGMTGGLLSAPRRTWRAFVRGRRSRSIYGDDYDQLMSSTVRELREQTGVDRATGDGGKAADAVLFGTACAAGLAIGTVFLWFAVALTPLAFAAAAINRRTAT